MYGVAITFRQPNVSPGNDYTMTTNDMIEVWRYRLYLMAVAKNKKFLIDKILATKYAFIIIQHLKRVCFQVQSRLHGDEILRATDWEL